MNAAPEKDPEIMSIIADLVNGDGFAFRPSEHFHLDHANGQLITINNPLEPKPEFSSYAPLCSGWTRKLDECSELKGDFLGSITSKSKEMNLNASVDVPISNTSFTLGGGASASRTRSNFQFECHVKIDKASGCLFFKPDVETAITAWDHLKEGSPIKQSTHYMDYAAVGGIIDICIRYSFEDYNAAINAHAKLSAANSLETFLEASTSIKRSGSRLEVHTYQNGFDLSESVPQYTDRKEDILSYYNRVAEWARKTKTTTSPPIVYLHARPLSAPEIGSLRPLDSAEGSISDQYYKAVVTRKKAEYVADSAHCVAKPEDADSIMHDLIDHHAVEYRHNLRIKCGDKFLGKNGKYLGFLPTPNCELRFVPKDGTPLTTVNSEKFEIHVYSGDKRIGFVLAQNDHLRFVTQAEYESDLEGKYGECYQFLLQTEEKEKALAVVAADSRTYHLLACDVKNKKFYNHSVSEGNFYLTATGTLSNKEADKVALTVGFAPNASSRADGLLAASELDKKTTYRAGNRMPAALGEPVYEDTTPSEDGIWRTADAFGRTSSTTNSGAGTIARPDVVRKEF